MNEGTNDSVVSTNQQTEKRPLLTDLLPAFATELQQLLTEKCETELAEALVLAAGSSSVVLLLNPYELNRVPSQPAGNLARPASIPRRHTGSHDGDS